VSVDRFHVILEEGVDYLVHWFKGLQ